MNLSLSNMLSGRVSGLDPDARDYIAAVVAAGATVSGGQKSAINTFIKTGKSDGWYSSLKRLYLPIWASAAPNAIDMIGLTSGTFNGTVTHTAGYVQGDGSTGYFDPGVGSEPNTLGLSNSSTALFAILLNNTDTAAVQVGSMTSTIAANNRFQFSIFGNQQQFTCPTNQVTTLIQTNDNITNGVFIGSVTATNVRYLYRRTTAGTAFFGNAALDTTALSTHRPFVLARNNTGTPDVFCSNARVGVAGWGLAVSGSDAPSFTLALKNLWETASGLTLEGAEYIAALRSAGATVTSTQESAIHNFIKTGKQQGWYSSLKRLYLPIWAAAAPNAIDMITRSSGTFNGTVTHAAGYVKGNGTTGYFDMGVSPVTLGLLTTSGHMAALTKFTAGGGARVMVGASDAVTDRMQMFKSGTSIFSRYIEAADGQISGTASDMGIITSSRTPGNRRLYRRSTSGRSLVTSNTLPDAGIMPTRNCFAMATSTTLGPSFFSDAEFGAYGLGIGMDDAADQAYTLALKNLWETCTGLVLP